MCQSYYKINSEKAKTHPFFHHYTNFETLLKILATNSIRLSEVSRLNDTIESNRIDPIFRRKIFVSCFEHNTYESIPMWKMYARDPYGVRISFSSLEFFNSATAYFIYRDEKAIPVSDLDWEIRNITVVDIEYLDDINKHVIYIEPLGPEFGQFPKPADIGFVKNQSWAYENETRVRVYIDVKNGKPSFRKSGPVIVKDHEVIPDYIYPDFDFLYCSLNSVTYENMAITFYPNMANEIREAIISSVNKYQPNFKNFKNSELDGKIRI